MCITRSISEFALETRQKDGFELQSSLCDFQQCKNEDIPLGIEFSYKLPTFEPNPVNLSDHNVNRIFMKRTNLSRTTHKTCFLFCWNFRNFLRVLDRHRTAVKLYGTFFSIIMKIRKAKIIKLNHKRVNCKL